MVVRAGQPAASDFLNLSTRKLARALCSDTLHAKGQIACSELEHDLHKEGSENDAEHTQGASSIVGAKIGAT